MTSSTRRLLVKRAGREQGFSLLELMVVLAIAAVATSLALPRVQGTGARSALEGSARRLASALQLAHAESLRTNRDQTITLDLDQKRYWLDQPSDQKPLGAFTALAVRDDTFEWDGTHRRIRFRPDGGATGGVITLRDGTAQSDIAIDWLTGVTILTTPQPRP